MNLLRIATMTKFIAFAIGAALAAAIATVIITQHRFQIGLGDDHESHKENRDRPADLSAEYPALSNLVAQTGALEASPDTSARELLRLRGEVGRLRRELESLRQEKDDEIEKVRAQNQHLPGAGDSLAEMFPASGLDTNSVPNIGPRATTNDVLAELRRVESNVLTEEENYIRAEIFPATVANTKNRLLAITMNFFFKDGRLVSRTCYPKWDRTSNQQ